MTDIEIKGTQALFDLWMQRKKEFEEIAVSIQSIGAIVQNDGTYDADSVSDWCDAVEDLMKDVHDIFSRLFVTAEQTYNHIHAG